MPERRVSPVNWTNMNEIMDKAYKDNNFDMVSYEYARLDEIQRVESIISELK